MLLTNYRRDSAGQSRALGGQLNPTLNLNLAKMNTFYVGDSSSLAPFQTNLIANSDFSIIPPGLTATTTAGRWIDGTAAGTVASTGYRHFAGWYLALSTSNGSGLFDTTTRRSGAASLRLSNLTAAGIASATTGITSDIYTMVLTAIPVSPSTSYTFTGYIKTNNVATDSAFFNILEYDGGISALWTQTTTKLSGTNDWTLITHTFTTTGTTQQVTIVARNNVAGNISDAWFDDISLTLTNKITRANTDNNNQYSSHPQFGLRPPYSLVLAPKEGGMSMYSAGTGSVSNAAQIAGYFASATLTGIGVISNGAMGLTVEMVAALAGTGSLSASIIGNLQAVATLTGSSTVTAAQSALAGMVASLAGSGLISDAQQEALGQMTANIYVNQSQATVQEIVDGVWEALTTDHNNPGTMGEAMNGAGSAGNPWITDLSAYNTANTAGKILKDRLSKNQFIGLK